MLLIREGFDRRRFHLAPYLASRADRNGILNRRMFDHFTIGADVHGTANETERTNVDVLAQNNGTLTGIAREIFADSGTILRLARNEEAVFNFDVVRSRQAIFEISPYILQVETYRVGRTFQQLYRTGRVDRRER